MAIEKLSESQALKIFHQTKLEKPEGADLTIVCNGETFYCHQAVLCHQCDFFDRATSLPFKEAETGTITMSDDDTVAVMLMLEYLYTHRLPSHIDVVQLFGGDLANVIALVAVADKYEIATLRGLGLHTIYLTFCDYLRGMDVDDGPAADECAERVRDLLRLVHGGQDRILDEVKEDFDQAFRSFPRVKYARTFEKVRGEFPYLSPILHEVGADRDRIVNEMRRKGELEEDSDEDEGRRWQKFGNIRMPRGW